MNHKVLIMMLYYERPILVRKALESILDANKEYQNWHLAFHDDASPTPGEAIVREVLPETCLERTTFYKTFASKEQKELSGGMLGQVMNQMIKDSDSDIAIILCDDDALHPEYLMNLNYWFSQHPEDKACYSHILTFDPAKENYLETKNCEHALNYYREPIDPTGRADASQVAWRTCLNKEDNIWFPYSCHKNHDMIFFQKMFKKAGPIPFSGFFSQYKAIHEDQLSQVDQPTEMLDIINKALDIAISYFLDGQYNNSKRLYEQILKTDPENIEAAQMLRKCIAVNSKMHNT